LTSPSITVAVAHEFTPRARMKGDIYFHANRVRLVSATGEDVDAVVTGSAPYHVTIRRTPDAAAFAVSCECAYFHQELAPCKHVWAAFRAAERGGFLLDGPTLPARARLNLVGADGVALESDDGVRAQLKSARPIPPLSVDRGAAALMAIESSIRAREHAAPVEFRYAGQELLYVFLLPASGTKAGRLALKVMRRRQKKQGEWTLPKPAPLTEDDLARAPDPDRRVLAALAGALRSDQGAYWTSHLLIDDAVSLPEALCPDLVPAIAQTGRAFVEAIAPGRRAATAGVYWKPPAPDGTLLRPLRWDDGPSWKFEPIVTRTNVWRVDGRLVRDDGDWLGLDDVMAVECGFAWTRTTVARADIGAFAPLLSVLLRERPIEIADTDASRLGLILAQLGAQSDALPEGLRLTRVDQPPVPCLRLTPLAPGSSKLHATVSFDYAGSTVTSASPTTVFDAGRRQLVVRRLAEESAAIERLTASGLRTIRDRHDDEARWELTTQQIATLVPALIAEGWRVDAEGRPFRAPTGVRLSIATGSPTDPTHDGSGGATDTERRELWPRIDWFDLFGDVEFGDVTAPLTDVLTALGRREPFVRLSDGSSGLLPDDWLRRYLPLAAIGEVVGDHLRFRQPQAALLDVLLDATADSASIDVDAGFRRARETLAALGTIGPVDPPPTFVGTLRDYQREGLGWLQFLSQVGFGGCLADDMGLGKTIMVLAMLLARRDDPARAGRPSFVVVPRSLVHNWIQEAERFAPSLRVRDYSTASRAMDVDLAGIDVLVATYGTLRRDVLTLKDVPIDYLILDEAQAIKNANTASAKAARLLRPQHRLALTGTPIENHIGELWSLFEFLNPGVLGRSGLFQRAATAAGADADTLNLLARGLRPFILRRTKQQVARELPPRSEQTILCELSKPERRLYEQIRQHYRASVFARVKRDGVRRAQMHILEALLRLRQAACHPALVDPAGQHVSSAKLEVLVSHLQEILDEGHKALLFSQFTTFLALVRRRLDDERISYAYLDGRTRDRAARVEQFQTDSECRLFLISLKAGGIGLNLTAAEYVFLLDPWWNPAVEAQAIDRTHRIGQTREVFAYRLVAENTIESKILELQDRKRALADAILGAGVGGLRGLQQEDLELLLS
jgi:superfamily II DNA or RNA helicase